MAAIERLEIEPMITLEAVVTNRLLPPLEVATTTIASLPLGPNRAAAVHHQALQAQQQQWLHALPDGPRLPYLFGIRTAGEIAEQLADVWDGAI